ncbi:hypothetical protein BCR33DRAFT_737793 [Rhizoclosmatium globosum]|uniref:Uncharacterized protein n=1 Tax=Rhizoclosmatium globosum TaxID=329046 RepID=A0A1Y2CD00_9FUNG|nr:hypothetical protein BCR33DRAFT_737793 [Rhizoclosmatium globosum]|eukprot:ORY44777.1 hypothetical protein BCR33DRAFT_737793 [Rhizoclosmatium globosum]
MAMHEFEFLETDLGVSCFRESNDKKLLRSNVSVDLVRNVTNGITIPGFKPSTAFEMDLKPLTNESLKQLDHLKCSIVLNPIDCSLFAPHLDVVFNEYKAGLREREYKRFQIACNKLEKVNGSIIVKKKKAEVQEMTHQRKSAEMYEIWSNEAQIIENEEE